MKPKLIFLLILIAQFSYSQNSKQSHENEIKGWESFFDGNNEAALNWFEKAIESDSANIYARIGLIYSKDEMSKSDLDWLYKLPQNGDIKNLSFSLMMKSQIEKQLPDSIKEMRRRHDEDYIQFKARLTDSKFKVYYEDGAIRKTGKFKEKRPSGIWKNYGYQNKLHHSFTFSEETDTVVIRHYTPDGEVAREVITTGMPFTNKSERIREIIYWQETPGKNIDYLFVSKRGFKVYDRENPVVLDETTPDNIIKMIYNPETHSEEAFIWKNGKKEPFEFCHYDGTITTYSENGVKKSFRWEDCKKVFIEK